MTCDRRDGLEKPLNDWIRHHPELDSAPDEAALSIQNIDFVVHQYLVPNECSLEYETVNLMLIEIKNYGATNNNVAQNDTFSLIDQALWVTHRQRELLTTMRGRKYLVYHGFHCLQLSGLTPDDSETMLWDGKSITTEQLIEILRFGKP